MRAVLVLCFRFGRLAMMAIIGMFFQVPLTVGAQIDVKFLSTQASTLKQLAS